MVMQFKVCFCRQSWRMISSLIYLRGWFPAPRSVCVSVPSLIHASRLFRKEVDWPFAPQCNAFMRSVSVYMAI
ncbi:hypothetical protein EC9_30790 [Rosistilla ulvae]|uniref:Uncharacterized protein n=1 Tax=Rosistilla ulvae TaxID=1930277 RepID=A0A517M1X5_9BACT|nr:hypothetical protein EC9_30790 [Rosistilla ulvae]